MSYVKSTLLPEEQILYYTRPHYIIFYQVLMWLALTLFMFVFIGTVLFAGLLLLMSLVIFIGALIGYYCSEYAITNRRVLMKVGFIRRKSLELFLDRIEGVYIDQGIVGRILNFGTVTIIGIGGTKNSFLFIPKPLNFRNKLQQCLVDRDGKN